MSDDEIEEEVKEGEESEDGEINKEDIILEACYDNIKEDKDLLIGFDPDAVSKNRIELNVNLIYFDKKITDSNDSYNYYKQFKVNVVGGFYASDEIDTFQKYLDAIKDLKQTPPYIVVTYVRNPKNFEDIYKICVKYAFIKEIIIITPYVGKYEKYLNSHKNLLKHISKNYDDLIEYLKKIGNKTTNWNKILKYFNNSRMFTYDEIKMNRQLSTCPIITAYEYDQLYFIVHRAYSHFFTNESLKKDPRAEIPPYFPNTNLKKVEEFLLDSDIDKQIKTSLLEKFKELNESDNFTEDAIKKYTGESEFCYLLNRVMRNFEKGLIKLAYYIGPLLFGLNKYALEHPNVCLNKDTTLYRKLYVNYLDKYIYKFSVGHIICFPSLTSTSFLQNQFSPTVLGNAINSDPFKNQGNKKDDNKIEIEMIIKYKHQKGNITPGIDISELSVSKGEREVLLFPFTFFRINNISEKPNSKNAFIFDMEIINRKKIIEYDLKEGIKYNVEELEDMYDENKSLNIEEGYSENFHVKERGKKKSACQIF